MDSELKMRLDLIQNKLDQTYKEAHAVKNYMKWTVIGTIVMFVLPLIAGVFIVPMFMSSLGSMYGGL